MFKFTKNNLIISQNKNQYNHKINLNRITKITFLSNKISLFSFMNNNSSLINLNNFLSINQNIKNNISFFIKKNFSQNINNSQKFNKLNSEEIENNLKMKFAEIKREEEKEKDKDANDINNTEIFTLKNDFFDLLNTLKSMNLLDKEKYSKYIEDLLNHEQKIKNSKLFEQKSFNFITDIIFNLNEEDITLISSKKIWEEFLNYLDINKNNIDFGLFVNSILKKLINGKIYLDYIENKENLNYNDNNSYDNKNNISNYKNIRERIFDIFIKEKLKDKFFFESLNLEETFLFIRIFADEFIEQGKVFTK
jgi:hypothetical protein